MMEYSSHARKSPPSVLTLSERFFLPDSFLKERSAPAAMERSQSATAGVGRTDPPQACARWLAEPIPDVSVDWCLENLLTELERSDYSNKFSNEDARFDWLLGRLCAKEAVRELVFELEDVHVPSQEIEIRTTSDGSPNVHFIGKANSINAATFANTMFISIAHSRKRAYVLALHTSSTERPGIDCEFLREVEPGMTELVFEAEERKFIEQQSTESEKYMAFFRLWTAREALLKATNSSDKRPFELLGVTDNQITVKHKGEERKILTLTHDGYAVAIVCC